MFHILSRSTFGIVFYVAFYVCFNSIKLISIFSLCEMNAYPIGNVQINDAFRYFKGVCMFFNPLETGHFIFDILLFFLFFFQRRNILSKFSVILKRTLQNY